MMQRTNKMSTMNLCLWAFSWIFTTLEVLFESMCLMLPKFGLPCNSSSSSSGSNMPSKSESSKCPGSSAALDGLMAFGLVKTWEPSVVAMGCMVCSTSRWMVPPVWMLLLLKACYPPHPYVGLRFRDYS